MIIRAAISGFAGSKEFETHDERAKRGKRISSSAKVFVYDRKQTRFKNQYDGTIESPLLEGAGVNDVIDLAYAVTTLPFGGSISFDPSSGKFWIVENKD